MSDGGKKTANIILRNPPQLSRKSNYYRTDKGTSTQTGNVRNFLFTNMPEQILDQRILIVYGYQSPKLTPTTERSLTRCLLLSRVSTK